MSNVYRKTERGQTEIATRQYKLAPRLRSALVVVDGKRSQFELASMIAGEPQETLQALLEAGFIELADGAAFLFKTRPLRLTEQAEVLLTADARALLAQISALLAAEQDWTTEVLEAKLKAYAEQQGLGLGKLAQPLRAALTGQTTSPGIFDVLALLGREESLARIDAQAAG